ncbi:MAG: hypothetical protein OXI48_01995, partial [bacterium]|nr:hypothetical protein [bacterium]
MDDSTRPRRPKSPAATPLVTTAPIPPRPEPTSTSQHMQPTRAPSEGGRPALQTRRQARNPGTVDTFNTGDHKGRPHEARRGSR